jgi:hypothetical protein
LTDGHGCYSRLTNFLQAVDKIRANERLSKSD